MCYVIARISEESRNIYLFREYFSYKTTVHKKWYKQTININVKETR